MQVDIDDFVLEDIPPVTVCVAAFCERDWIIGASDRKLTVGNIGAEPERQKSYGLTASIAVMTAGEAPISYEILADVGADVATQIQTTPERWQTVKDVSQMICDAYNVLRQREIENEYLARLGLTYASFLQLNQNDALATKIADDLMEFAFPDVQFIVCGWDPSGMHLWQIRNAAMRCRDSLGYAAIGSGATQSVAHFLAELHTRKKPFLETLYRTFVAKKRAEIVSGVGSATDMFIAYGANKAEMLNREMVIDLEREHRSRQRRRQNSDAKFYKQLKRYEDEIGQKPAENTTTPEIADTSIVDGAGNDDATISDSVETS